MFKTVLTVCTGNICRSPLAEALLRASCPSVDVSSAGVGAMVGHPVTDQIRALATAHGLDVSRHRARQLSDRIISQNELILTAEQRQLEWIHKSFPQSRGRVFMLTKWTGGEDIEDPFQRSMSVYDAAFDDIKQAIEEWKKRIS